jgi:putative ABC transport system ATP-binding protein
VSAPSTLSPRDAPAEPLARVVGASKVYDRGDLAVTALADVDLEVRAGEMVAVLGPSGCGKSTLLNVLAGVDRLDAGRAVVAGMDLGSASESGLVDLRRRRIGIVFQAFHLVPNLTAQENVALPLALAGVRDPARVTALLARVGLAERAPHFPAELSGGERQRVALARALVHRPQLLLADEPTGNLDSAAGLAVLELLDELRVEERAAVVLATHDERIAARADRRVRMRDGRIVATD